MVKLEVSCSMWFTLNHQKGLERVKAVSTQECMCCSGHSCERTTVCRCNEDGFFCLVLKKLFASKLLLVLKHSLCVCMWPVVFSTDGLPRGPRGQVGKTRPSLFGVTVLHIFLWAVNWPI